MGKKTMGFGDEAPTGGKDVKETSQLTPGANEKYQTGKNTTSRNKGKHPKFGKLGSKGHPE